MKQTLTTAALALALAFGATTASAKVGRHKRSPEHAAAVKKCQDDYKSAATDAKTKKGKDRSDALKAAQKTRKDCIAAAPK